MGFLHYKRFTIADKPNYYAYCMAAGERRAVNIALQSEGGYEIKLVQFPKRGKSSQLILWRKSLKESRKVGNHFMLGYFAAKKPQWHRSKNTSSTQIAQTGVYYIAVSQHKRGWCGNLFVNFSEDGVGLRSIKPESGSTQWIFRKQEIAKKFMLLQLQVMLGKEEMIPTKYISKRS